MSAPDPRDRPPTWSPLRPGDALGGCTIERELGAGGMGRVYAARDRVTGASRAIKVLEAGADPELRLRFAREGRAQAAVDAHPHVVRVHAAGEEGGRQFLVLDLLEGGDLSARLRGGPLEPAAAAALVAALARGLAHVHARGVLHRDLKPHNVLFDEEGRPRLVDFGLARIAAERSLTATGTILGTPAYMAPEQADGRPADERTDVYGLGAVLYHCLTGRAPVVGSSLLQELRQILEGAPPAPRSLRPGVPAALERVCLRALARRPEDRFPSASALAEAREGAGTPASRGPGRVAAGLLLLGGVGLLCGLALRDAARTGGAGSVDPVERVGATPPPPLRPLPGPGPDPVDAQGRPGPPADEGPAPDPHHPALRDNPLFTGQLEAVRAGGPGAARAMDELAVAFERGLVGLPRDPEQALAWAHAAARSGHPGGKLRLGRHLLRAEDAASRARGVALLEEARAAPAGELQPEDRAEALRLLLDCYARSDPERALAIARELRGLDDVTGLLALADFALAGTGEPGGTPAPDRALELLLQARARGSGAAAVMAGRLLLEGWLGPPDASRAAGLLASVPEVDEAWSESRVLLAGAAGSGPPDRGPNRPAFELLEQAAARGALSARVARLLAGVCGDGLPGLTVEAAERDLMELVGEDHPEATPFERLLLGQAAELLGARLEAQGKQGRCDALYERALRHYLAGEPYDVRCLAHRARLELRIGDDAEQVARAGQRLKWAVEAGYPLAMRWYAAFLRGGHCRSAHGHDPAGADEWDRQADLRGVPP